MIYLGPSQLNRFDRLLAYDHSRVTLRTPVITADGMPTDYVNANYVHGFKLRNEYIAAQSPFNEGVFDS